MSKIKWERNFPGLVHTNWAGKKVYYYRSIDSTNLKAGELATRGAAVKDGRETPHGSLVLADRQTAGKGRSGRQWDSPAGENLYFTLILYPRFPAGKASMLTLVMALAVSKALGEATGVNAGIKWPNDIVVDGRKVVGILTQMQAQAGKIAYVIIGVGINVARREFTGELAGKATSLENELGKKVSRETLLAGVLEHFELLYERFCQRTSLRELRPAYESRLVNRGRQVRVLDPAGEFTGTALGINDTGELLVETEDGAVQTVYAGEVSVRGVYGYV